MKLPQLIEDDIKLGKCNSAGITTKHEKFYKHWPPKHQSYLNGNSALSHSFMNSRYIKTSQEGEQNIRNRDIFWNP